jgi:hypothetical protein
MSRSRGPGDETRSTTDKCLLSDLGDDNVAFAALRTCGVVNRVTDAYVSTV